MSHGDVEWTLEQVGLPAEAVVFKWLQTDSGPAAA